MDAAPSYVTIDGPDGAFAAYQARPAEANGAGILLFQEIFGINDNMRTIADRLAARGYLVFVPDMFWRIEPRFERKDESGMADAFEVVAKFDFVAAVRDINATHAALREACGGKVGALGFCLGGGLAFAAATMSRVGGTGPDAAVCYYGSPINGMLDRADDLECPTLFHYGTDDPYIPEESVAEVTTAVGAKPGVEIYRYQAGHAFSNWDAPSLYNQAAADEAWAVTLEFLDRHLT